MICPEAWGDKTYCRVTPEVTIAETIMGPPLMVKEFPEKLAVPNKPEEVHNWTFLISVFRFPVAVTAKVKEVTASD